MAYLSERIGQRVLEICDGTFTKNVKFEYSKKCEIKNLNTKDECISVIYTIKYGLNKEFKMVNSIYPNYINKIQRPVIYSNDERLTERKIDLDIARLYKLLA